MQRMQRMLAFLIKYLGKIPARVAFLFKYFAFLFKYKQKYLIKDAFLFKYKTN